ncbi:Ectoine hydroxylase-related dioxygenase, phytanoyl-CoA dioxygenase (PhyH) family [Pseudorhodobacter antarcticus]|uniref:Ectoine hydroxylase-related dioxygenase, phytanoyl-CoA dioxygenase (PhyH) family n=1 Tax=Pseudorhodobacter antarcticus TaxID=1077947 RepID=A0A1H8E8R0_9RHOB|nr:phytanoyl-CoA dioxygenase family protein [Pseudorhodobacter antarcticus]SEN15842.1 Ectoine hydroxylase-related dioxygenase, phytanoyl-CoA dioxygenase (PhyH) family [Pseudorhodobacter antarcticus]
MLSPTQIQQFETTGYLVVDNVLDADRLAAIKAEYSVLMDHLYANWHGVGRVPDGANLDFWGKLLAAYSAGCDWFQPMDISLPGEQIQLDTPFHFGPAVFDMVTNPRLLDMVEQLIGPEITSNPIQHVRIKPPSTTLRDTEIRAHITTTDWHQDRAVALEVADQTQMVTVWLAITDATLENGCLQVLPGKVGMLPHCPKTQTAIADGFIDPARAQPLPVKAGGAVIFHPLTPHASLANQTDGFRWSFDLRYNVTGQNTGRSHFPDFIARSRTSPSAELHDWQAWAQMWHAARTRLATAPQTPIHRWHANSPACA